MPDDLEFAVERGKALGSMAVAVVAAGAATGPVALTLGLVAGVVGFAAEVVSMFLGEDAVDDSLDRRLDVVEKDLAQLRSRVDTLAVRQALDANLAKLRHTRLLFGEVSTLADEIRRARPDADWIGLTHRAGMLADQWLAEDLDLWRWHEFRTPRGEPIHPGNVTINYDQFATLPALPYYAVAVGTWLAARERAIDAKEQLAGDARRISAHHDAVRTRAGFRPHDPKLPANTLPENLADRVVQWVNARTQHADRGVCVYDISAENLMTGERRGPDQPRIESGLAMGAQCIPKIDLASGRLHHTMIGEAGGTVMDRLEIILRTVAMTGRLRPLGGFGQVPHPLPLLLRTASGGIKRLVHPGGATRSGLPSCQPAESWSTDVTEPYVAVVSGGGPFLYALRDDRRRLVQLTHAGGETWHDPVIVAGDLGDVVGLVGGGEAVVYTRHADGRLVWWRHDGQRERTTRWRGPVTITTLAPDVRVLGAGGGLLYLAHPDGRLVLHRHAGYLDGTPDIDDGTMLADVGPDRHWSGGMVCAIGRTFYVGQPDGGVSWYRWERLPLLGGGRGRSSPGAVLWHGPVTVATGLGEIAALLPQLHAAGGPLVR